MDVSKLDGRWLPDLHFRYSFRYARFLLLLHGSVLVWLGLWATSIELRLGLALLVLCHGFWLIAREVWLMLPNSPLRLRWTRFGWVLTCKNGCEKQYVLHHSTWRQTGFVYLVLEPVQKRLWHRLGVGKAGVAIFPDRVGCTAFRRLQVFLNWQSPSIVRPELAESGCVAGNSVDNSVV